MHVLDGDWQIEIDYAQRGIPERSLTHSCTDEGTLQ